jgi:tRNA threonylcarbamoyladenosine biosynthesis protein TsaB
MLILALDSSLDGCSAALLKDHQVLGEEHTTQSGLVFSLVEDLLKTHGLDYHDLGAIAVTRGPGSFTGLRLGLAASQGWCLAGRIPLWGVTTLDALAYQAAENTRSLMVGISTKRDDFYGASYAVGSTKPSKMPEIMPLDALKSHADTHRVVVWAEPGHPVHQDASVETVQLKAASVGFLAWSLHANPDAAFSSEPFYLRPAKVYEDLNGHKD